MASSEFIFQPGGHAESRCMNLVPFIFLALRNFLSMSSGKAGVAVAAYGIECAAMISIMFFLGLASGRSMGVVVVQAPTGVEDER